MSSTSNYDTGSTPILPSRNVVLNNIRSNTGEIDNLSVNLINGLPPPSAPPIGAPLNSILTVTSPGVATFTDSAKLTDLEVTDQIKVSGSNGTSNQVMTKFGSNPSWNLLTQSNFAPNVNNSALITGPGGIVSFAKVPPLNIEPGSSYQVLQTNSGGSVSQWTSSLNVNSILFTGNVSNFQSTFDRYYSSNIFLPIYATALGGSPNVYQNNDALAFYTVIGKRVEMTIFPFDNNTTLNPGSPASYYISLQILPSFLKVKNLRNVDDKERQSTSVCNISQNNSTQLEPSYINAYNNYYGTNGSYLEIVTDNSGTFVSNARHGGLFTDPAMSLKAPFTISYICE